MSPKKGCNGEDFVKQKSLVISPYTMSILASLDDDEEEDHVDDDENRVLKNYKNYVHFNPFRESDLEVLYYVRFCVHISALYKFSQHVREPKISIIELI